MRRFFIDRESPLPAHVQLKEQIKFAWSYKALEQGDPLPSIRTLARQLGVGDAVVRRAYSELRELGLLSTARRRHVAVSPALGVPPDVEHTLAELTSKCDDLTAWAHQKGLSSISMCRALFRRALTREAASPSYVFVDLCTRTAHEFAEQIASAWEIKVAAVSLSDLAKLSREELGRFTTILVNGYLYEDVLELAGVEKSRVFCVRISLAKLLVRRIRRLPPKSSVLFVFADEYFPRIGKAVVQHCYEVVGKRWRLEAKPARAVPDLGALVKTRRYRLILVGPALWDNLPDKLRRMPTVTLTARELDIPSLEEIRVAAGVLV